ncbi:protein of unknown function [Methanoculleus bourgensis]|uniref:Uncharacterized protein n=1 Tax=Methanoculleus bourgensis TaxID=83986 RepID=A0A0X3BKB7_9EURY|nr:protein of unknown function [Methanoculleus bourgensis]
MLSPAVTCCHCCHSPPPVNPKDCIALPAVKDEPGPASAGGGTLPVLPHPAPLCSAIKAECQVVVIRQFVPEFEDERAIVQDVAGDDTSESTSLTFSTPSGVLTRTFILHFSILRLTIEG